MAPDFEAAKQYALDRLARELSPVLIYHSLEHTRDEVVPAAERLARMEGLTGEPLLLLRTAAYFHDLGFVERYLDNEVIAVRIAAENLPRFGYTPEQIKTITGIIMVTRLPQTPHNHMEEIMADADLDGLGREDFIEREHALRAEWTALGRNYTEEEWYREQVTFLQSHHYFTESARRLRQAGQQYNIDCCLQILAKLS
ncbi:MAG: phosphohydrolase [Anaerolineae bacterium]